MNQMTFTDMEYSNRKKRTKREEFLDDGRNHSMGILGGYDPPNAAANLLALKPCFACISCRYGSICQMRE